MSNHVNGELVPAGGGDNIPLLRESLTIGRRESCDICMRFPNISGLHAEMAFRNGYWYIKDRNSTNGIKVNGSRVQEKLLHPNDEVMIGKRVYIIHYDMPADRPPVEDDREEDILSQSLLEKAGLAKPKAPPANRSRGGFDPADFLLSDDE